MSRPAKAVKSRCLNVTIHPKARKRTWTKNRHPGLILHGIWKEAKLRTGWTNAQLNRHVEHRSWTPFWKVMPSYEKFIAVSVLAGVPKAVGPVLYAKLHVPEEVQHYVGSTVIPGHRKGNWKAQREQFVAFIESLIQFTGPGNAKAVDSKGRIQLTSKNT